MIPLISFYCHFAMKSERTKSILIFAGGGSNPSCGMQCANHATDLLFITVNNVKTGSEISDKTTGQFPERKVRSFCLIAYLASRTRLYPGRWSFRQLKYFTASHYLAPQQRELYQVIRYNTTLT